MNISIEQLLKNSYVLTTSFDRLNKFYSIFKNNNLNILPKPYFGRIVEKTSNEFKYNAHYIAAHGSHFEICEFARLNNMPFVCIFEDDSYPCFNIIDKLQYYLNDIPNDAYIYKLGFVPFENFKYLNLKLPKIECITDFKYQETYFGGSHAYIIFKSFYNISNIQYQTYLRLLKYKDTISLHNPKNFTNDQLKNIWLYEWLITPNVYINNLQKHIYSVNCNENLFTQYQFIKWNNITEKIFNKNL